LADRYTKTMKHLHDWRLGALLGPPARSESM
jgi:hypothetical protein